MPIRTSPCRSSQSIRLRTRSNNSAPARRTPPNGGSTLGGGADQTATLVDILDNVASAKGRELGNMILPPGKIEIATNWVIDQQRGIKVVGVAATAAQDGPRDHGGWTDFMTGTSLYWTGSSGGTIITLQRTREVWLEDLDIFLGESSTDNHAAIAILHSNSSGFGNGGNSLRNVAIVSPAHGGIGLQFSTTTGENNNDTFYAEHLMLWNLATGIKLVSDNALDYCLTGAQVYNTDTFIDADHGGHVWVFGSFMVDNRASQNLTILRVGTGGSNAASYRLDGFHVDRQGNYQHVTVFDTYSAANTCIASCSGIFLRQMTTPEEYDAFDGTKPASFEVGNRNVIHANGCNLQGQPVVRFRGTHSTDRAAIVQLDTCIVQSGRAIGGELVTCNEGGSAGEVVFNDCQREHDLFNATVGQLCGPGNSNTHKDETVDSDANVINGFDAWPSLTPTDFYDSSSGKGSWLGVTYQPEAYWRCDDPFPSGSTTVLKDLSGNGYDLSINSEVLVDDAPLPYLERCANWSNKTGTVIVDTMIDADPAEDDLTFFGFARLNEIANEVMFGVDPGGPTAPQLWFGAVYSSGQPFGTMLITKSNGGGSNVANFSGAPDKWFHFVFSWNAQSKVIKAFINGIRHLSATNTNLAGISAGDVVIGGNHLGGSRPYKGRFSRIGILKGRALNDKESTLLFLRSSTVVQRGAFRPL